jgi:cell division protein ZapA (FtsZ GTPase activity inhibitor)
MNTECKNYTVTIFGQEYTLKSDESFEIIAHIASLVDVSMREIATKTQLKETAPIAVLVAFKTMHSLYACKAEISENVHHHELLLKQVDQALKMLDSFV